jgi:hypothetical protein
MPGTTSAATNIAISATRIVGEQHEVEEQLSRRDAMLVVDGDRGHPSRPCPAFLSEAQPRVARGFTRAPLRHRVGPTDL